MRRAVDVMYGVCDAENVQIIVKDLLSFLKTSDYAVREEVVLKIAILAEKHATDYTWYVNVVLTLITLAGDHIADEVWHRVLQIVTNVEDVQGHAAKTVFQAMLDPSCHENMVKVGAYILGEFGHLIANDPGSLPQRQLDILQTHYPMVSLECRGVLLSTYAKFTFSFPELKSEIQTIFRSDNVFRSAHAEIQQRGNEYFNLSTVANPDVVPAVLKEMPIYEEKQSRILSKLENSKDTTDKVGSLTAIGGGAVETTAPPGAPLKNDEFLAAFLTSDQAKLFESSVLQVGAKIEYAKQHARVTLFYGNRAAEPMTDVETNLFSPSEEPGLKLSAQEMPPTLQPGAQVPQVLTLECLESFKEMPVLDVSLKYQGKAIVLRLVVPITVNKFLAPLPTPMDQAQFGAKWQQIGGPPREVTISSTPEDAFDNESLSAALEGAKFAICPGIDPRPQNLVCAGLLNTTGGIVGVLMRVEPNVDACTIQYTIRASNETAGACLATVLSTLMP